MGIGPVFECPHNLISRIPQLASLIDVKVERHEEAEAKERLNRYVFKARFAKIEGAVYRKDNAEKIWLVFPYRHAFNPLFWPADFRLSKKIEQMLLTNGARRCEWDLPDSIE